MSDAMTAQGAAGLRRRERRPARMAAVPGARATAASLVQDTLRRDILDMRMKPGAPLWEKDLTSRFGISRTPLREALIRLKEDGLVEVFPQAGTFVARIPVGAIPEAVIVRQALECATVEIATGRIDGAAMARLEAAIARQSQFAALGDYQSFHGADDAFHESIAEIAGFPGIWKLAHAAKSQIDRCRRMTLPVPGRMQHVISEHLIILEALRRRQPEAAVAGMRVHLVALLPDLPVLLEQHPDYFV